MEPGLDLIQTGRQRMEPVSIQTILPMEPALELMVNIIFKCKLESRAQNESVKVHSH
jgi:hypothetical protein